MCCSTRTSSEARRSSERCFGLHHRRTLPMHQEMETYDLSLVHPRPQDLFSMGHCTETVSDSRLRLLVGFAAVNPADLMFTIIQFQRAFNLLTTRWW